MTENRGCPEGCSYIKDGLDKSDTWCIKPGPYSFELTCPATATPQMSTQPADPSPTTRVTIQYEEDGEVFEQEDMFNNMTGEATLSVPAHGNNSAVDIIIQEATVSVFKKTKNLFPTLNDCFLGYLINSWRPGLSTEFYPR